MVGCGLCGERQACVKGKEVKGKEVKGKAKAKRLTATTHLNSMFDWPLQIHTSPNNMSDSTAVVLPDSIVIWIPVSATFAGRGPNRRRKAPSLPSAVAATCSPSEVVAETGAPGAAHPNTRGLSACMTMPDVSTRGRRRAEMVVRRWV